MRSLRYVNQQLLFRKLCCEFTRFEFEEMTIPEAVRWL